MLDNTHPETLKAHFEQSVEALDRVLRKLHLMKRIDQREAEVEGASHEERARIMADIEACRQEIKQIDRIDQC